MDIKELSKRPREMANASVIGMVVLALVAVVSVYFFLQFMSDEPTEDSVGSEGDMHFHDIKGYAGDREASEAFQNDNPNRIDHELYTISTGNPDTSYENWIVIDTLGGTWEKYKEGVELAFSELEDMGYEPCNTASIRMEVTVEPEDDWNPGHLCS